MTRTIECSCSQTDYSAILRKNELIWNRTTVIRYNLKLIDIRIQPSAFREI